MRLLYRNNAAQGIRKPYVKFCRIESHALMNNHMDTHRDQSALERWSAGAKDFYSAGASFSTIACAGTVLIIWSTLGELASFFKSPICGVTLSFLIVFAYAFILPEPPGYPNAGRLK